MWGFVVAHETGQARVVLVTGVSRRLGSRIATQLQADAGVHRVIGVDTEAPTGSLGRTEVVCTDTRATTIASVIDAAHVDTVIHTGFATTSGGSCGNVTGAEANVIGTMQLLAACQRASTVRRLVARSTTVIYGSSPHAPALFTEDMEPVELPRHGVAKRAWEVESYVRGLARRRPDISVSILRFANVIGPGVDSTLTRYFMLPVMPTVLGFDPRLQFVHEDDALEVLRRMALDDHPGIFNVSGDGVMMLSQAVRRAGRPSLPVPARAARWGGELFKRAAVGDFSPHEVRLLSHGRAVDSSRLCAELGWRPTYTTVEAFDDFVAGAGGAGPWSTIPTDVVDQLHGALFRPVTWATPAAMPQPTRTGQVDRDNRGRSLA